MSTSPRRVRVLKLAIILTAVFNVLGLLVLLHGTPRVFAVFMFVGESVFMAVIVLLIAAIVADLRAKELL
jgi:hypothetical protein